MLKNLGAYLNDKTYVLDEASIPQSARCVFLAPSEERWYQETLDKYRKEFGLRPCAD